MPLGFSLDQRAAEINTYVCCKKAVYYIRGNKNRKVQTNHETKNQWQIVPAEPTKDFPDMALPEAATNAVTQVTQTVYAFMGFAVLIAATGFVIKNGIKGVAGEVLQGAVVIASIGALAWFLSR